MRNSKFTVILIAILVIAGLALSVNAQTRVTNTDAETRMRMYGEHEKMMNNTPYKDMKWQFVGPTNVSGRITDVAVAAPKGKYYTMYVAAASGGVWKTTNEGDSWKPVFEQGPSTSIGDVTLDPKNPDVVWVGTGEANIFRSSMAGAGVFKSVDGGESWEHMGLAGTHTIPRIVVHPKNTNTVYVAASGNEWTANEERGVYKTTDGGKTWEKIFFINDMTGAIDLVMDPKNNNTLYAAMWQRVREKWSDPRVEDGYDKSGIYKTTNGGKSWTRLNEGLPKAEHTGRVGIDLCLTNPNVLYAFIDNYEILKEPEPGETDAYGRPKVKGDIKAAEVYKSTDKGKTWNKMSVNDRYMAGLGGTYGWVFGQLRVDPNDENTVYIMGLALNVSNDSGKTWRRLPGMHGDHHGLWIDPDNSNYLVNTNDGGVVISYDAGVTWKETRDKLPLVQFFNLSLDNGAPFMVYGSVQDHGSYRGVVDLKNGRDRVPAVDFEGAPGGEGSSHAIDPVNKDIVYSAGFYGRISRTDMGTKVPGWRGGYSYQSTSILPNVPEGDPPFRGQWLAPFIISHHNNNHVYLGWQQVYKTESGGLRTRQNPQPWKKISPDLTYNDPSEMGDISYQTIFSISESPLKQGLLYAGTDDGRVHVTQNDGGNWKEIMRSLPYKKWVSRLVASQYDVSTVYMTQNGKRDEDFVPYVWKSTNYGDTWTSIAANIPIGPVNVIREDPKNENILYVGTDMGVYISTDKGRSWNVLGDLPSTFVSDIKIHPIHDMIVISTHGRGIWTMDVRELQKKAK